MSKIILEGIIQTFNQPNSKPLNSHINSGSRIYDEGIFKEHFKRLEIEMKIKNRIRKMDNILSNIK